MNLMYCSVPLATCYDGEDTPEGEGAEPRTFTQDEVNEFLARDRRKHQATLKKTEQAYKRALENKELAAAERQSLEASLGSVQTELRNYRQQAEQEKRQLEEQHNAKLAEKDAEAQSWKQLYHTSTIHRDLMDAAVKSDAFDTDQIVQLLDRNTKLVEIVNDKGKPTGKYKTVVEFTDTDAEGNAITRELSPDETLKRMREIPRYANLFRSNITPGVGGGDSGGNTFKNGKLDPRKLAENPELYRKLRKENPGEHFGQL